MCLSGDLRGLYAFALVMMLGQFSPGPDMILLTRTSLAEGWRAGILTVLGIVTGLAFHATLALAGMAAVLAAGGWLEIMIKILAAGYLVWLASSLLRSQGHVSQEKLSCHSPYLRGLFCNLLNPKVAIFFAGAVAPFLAYHSPVVLGLVILLEGVVLWSLWVVFLQNPSIRSSYLKAGKWLDRMFGMALLSIAGFTISTIF